MWLNKNQKKVLQLLLGNAKLTDTSIADELDISSQAVGKIRKELEETLIKKYTLEVDTKKLGLGVLALLRIVLVKETEKQEAEKEIVAFENTIFFTQNMVGDRSYVLIMGFGSFDELEEFINGHEKIRDKFIVHEVIPFSQRMYLKNSSEDLLQKLITGNSAKKVIEKVKEL